MLPKNLMELPIQLTSRKHPFSGPAQVKKIMASVTDPQSFAAEQFKPMVQAHWAAAVTSRH